MKYERGGKGVIMKKEGGEREREGGERWQIEIRVFRDRN